MNPFDGPPTTPPVSFGPPPGGGAPRRRTMALVALASAGLLGVGIVGVSAFAGAGDPVLDSAPAGAAPLAGAADPTPGRVGVGGAPPTTADEAGAEPDGGEPDATPADEPDGSGRPDADAGTGPVLDGELRIDTGDGDPIVIDLGELDAGALAACIGSQLGEGMPDLDSLFREFESMLEQWDLPHRSDPPGGGSGPHPPIGGGLVGHGEVTVLGPDGVTVIDLGDGDGSVTITRDGETGELTITTDGTASEQSLDELLADVFADVPSMDAEPDPPAPPRDLGFPSFPGGLADCLADAG